MPERAIGAVLAKCEWCYERIMRVLPASVAAQIDYMRPSFRDGWGGPLNGQRHRQRMVREIVKCLEPTLVVETGTYRGTTTEFLAHLIDGPVHSVEAEPRFHKFAARRLRGYPQVVLWQGDSRAILGNLADQPDLRLATAFFYLDAHWGQGLPLAEELNIISGGWDCAVVLIDDFEVPDDVGYLFDDYGPGLRLTNSYIPDALDRWSRYYPSVPSGTETGSRRGSIVLASPGLRERISQCKTIKEAAISA